MNYDYLTRVVLFFVVLFLTISIQAQTAVLDTINPINLDEIVINASKNNLKIKELPAAVSVIQNTVIEHENVVKMSDLTSLSPNFYMPDYGSKLTSPIYIRGIGSRINAPSVGLYVDHVPYFEKSAFQFDFFDIEKVEILRGPQGTLYGRNTMGGIINILTLSPDKYQGTKFKSSIGNYGQYGFNAGYYKRINKQWSTSVSGNFVHNDGFFTNEFSDSTVDKIDSYGLRHRLKFKPSKRFDIENIAAFENSTQGGYPYAVYDTATKTTSPVNYDRYSSYDRTLFSDALHLNYNTDHWKLSNTTSFQLLNDEQNIDQDFSPENLYYITQFQDQKTVSNELLIQSVNSGRYSWLVGIFGFNQAFDNKVNVNLYTHDMEYLKTFDKSIRGAAVFHQSTLKVTDKFSVVAGIRYDYEQSELHYLYEGAMAGVTLPPQDTIYPHLKEGVLLPKIALNYQRDQMSVYASYSSGYKPGGFNTTFERPEHLTFNNELSNSYELGLKATIFKDMFSTDFSVFYNYLKNQQIYNTVPSGHGSYLSNAGKSYNQGFEWSLNLQEIKGWQGMVSYGNTYSKIIEYVKDANTNYNHKFTPYVPRSMFAAQLSKMLEINRISFIDDIALTASYRRIGKQYWDLSNQLEENPYHLVHARLSFNMGDVQLSLWGKNLFNESYHTFIFSAVGNVFAQKNRPRTFGVDVSLKL